MRTITATYQTTLNVTVTLKVPDDIDDDQAEDWGADQTWERAEEYANTLTGNESAGVTAEASFDGIGAGTVTVAGLSPAGDDESDADDEEEVCGETYDHDAVTDYDGPDGQQWSCRRCGAEGWSPAEQQPTP